ncbi:MAG: nucleotidyltransferase domain-containing protein [Thermoplasmata archaeon]
MREVESSAVLTNLQLIPALREFKRKVAKKYGIERMILFGSHVSGKTGNDVDLLIVARRKENLMSELYHEWHSVQKMNYPVDFVCYTPEEFERLRKQVSLVRDATNQGVEIW